MTSALRQLDPLAGLVLEVLINSLWQGAALAALVWCVLRMFRRTNATTRYAVWCVTLATIFCLPLLASLRAGHASIARVAEAGSNSEAPSAPGRVRLDAVGAEAGRATTAGDDVVGAGGFPLTISLGRWALLGAGLYLFVVALMLTRVAMSYRRLRRLKRKSAPLSGAYQTRLEELLKACRVGRAVRLAASREIAMPLAAGLGDAVILIPRKLVDELTEAEFDQILLHELAHIRRYDDWTNLLQKLSEAIFFFNPAVRWVGTRLNLEREVACDDWVIWTVGERRPYANCLTRLVELVSTRRPASLAPGAATVRKHVFKRVELLLDRKRNSLPRLSRASCVVMLCVLSAALLQFLRVPTVFAVSAGAGDAARVLAVMGPGAPSSPTDLNAAGPQTGESAQAESEGSREYAVTGAAGADVRGASEVRLRSARGGAGAAQVRPEESRAEFDRQLQELMEPKVREAERQMLEVMQPKIHEVEREVHRLMGPKLDEASRLQGEAARERERELQREVELSLGAKKRELQRRISQMMEPRVREIEREARQTLLQRRRGGGR